MFGSCLVVASEGTRGFKSTTFFLIVLLGDFGEPVKSSLIYRIFIYLLLVCFIVISSLIISPF